jgi:hypothetical protein
MIQYFGTAVMSISNIWAKKEKELRIPNSIQDLYEYNLVTGTLLKGRSK